MKIEVSKKTEEIVKWALEVASKMYAGDIGNSVDEICHKLCLMPLNRMTDEFKTELNKVVIRDSKKFSMKNMSKEISETLFTDKFIEDEEHLKFVAEMLDIVIRMAGGQWEMLYHIQSTVDRGALFLSQEDRKTLERLKDEYFGTDYYFGINSITLNDDVRVIYDFYKVWMFEMGAGGCYSYDVYPLSKEKLPVIHFKPIKSWYIEKLEDIESLYKTLSENEKKDVYEEKYFKTSNYISYIPQPGETLVLRRNGLYGIVEGKLETEN